MEEFKTRATVFHLAVNTQLSTNRERVFLCRAKMKESQRHAARRIPEAAAKTSAFAKLQIAARYLALKLHVFAYLCARGKGNARTVFITQRQMKQQILNRRDANSGKLFLERGAYAF
jgi:hypothetical protein